MARGLPDYGVDTTTSMAAGMADVGEAAARLGSINVFDRRGFVAWMDDFEEPALKWDRAFLFGGVNPVLSNVFAFMGSASILLECGAAAAPISRIGRTFAVTRLGRVGIEWCTQANVPTLAYLELVLSILDGTNETTATLRYYPFDGEITIVHSTATTIVATDIYMLINSNYFLPLKLVVDMDSDAYVRLLIGEREIDLSAYLMVPTGVTTTRAISCVLRLYGNAAGASYAYLDNFIYTVAEP